VKIFKDKSVVMDDEKYFSLSNINIPGNDIFYTSDKSTAPNEIKYAMKKKFEDKVLVWVAISEQGLSKHYVHRSKIAISSDIYIKECLKKRLLPFIKEHHKDNDFVFWPDLASAHYSNQTITWLDSRNIDFVKKVHNPPNVPQARPIETF
jgi:hypothetical protein